MNFIASIQPIVLVGGRSRRFGRDKLREPMPDDGRLTDPQRPAMLVDRPIAALREVFGQRVAVVGECHEAIVSRADVVMADRYPGVGPIGGIVSALETHGGDVFVLPGDLPWITAEVVRAILDHAAERAGMAAVLARTARLEPCVGVYRQAALPMLQSHLASGRRSLHDAVDVDSLHTVTVDAAALVNVNTPDALHHGPVRSATE